MEGKDIKFVDLMLPIMRFYIGYADEGTWMLQAEESLENSKIDVIGIISSLCTSCSKRLKLYFKSNKHLL